MDRTRVTRFTLIADDVRSILNVGALFRTADAVGVGMVWLTGFTPGPDNQPERIAKTALGAEHTVPWARARRVGDVVRRLRRQGVQVVALERMARSVDYRSFRPQWPLALIVGNEVKGVSKSMSHNADAIVSIPMRGSKE
jgi:23S rRNA (guanosine2251-2'-O)-methyltransferase